MKKLSALCALLVLFVFSMSGCNKNYELNKDFFSEIGMAREQLNEKYTSSDHGKEWSATYAEYDEVPNRMYYFENGKCVEILNFGKGELFTNYDKNFSPEEIAQRYGVKFLVSRGEVDMVQSYYLLNDVVISITTTPSSLEGVRTINEIAAIDRFNIIEYQGFYFDPSPVESRYQIFGSVAIGVPEGATIEDFLSDPLAKALMDAWETELIFGNGKGKVTSGELVPGMYIRPDNNTTFSVIPYVEELKNK